MRYMRYFHSVKLKSGRFTMVNGRVICLVVLCVLFIVSAVFAQTDTITEKIYQSEEKIREHVDNKFEGIERKISGIGTKVDNLNTKVGTLSTDLAVNKTNIEYMKEGIGDLKRTADRIWYGILGIWGILILAVVGYFLKLRWEGQGKADNVNGVGHLNEKIINLTSAQAENSAQIIRLISAQAAISETRDLTVHPEVPNAGRVDEFIDDIQATHKAAGIV